MSFFSRGSPHSDDNQHPASQVPQRRDACWSSAHPCSTSLRPPGYQQQASSTPTPSQSESSPRRRRPTPTFRIEAPWYVAVGLMTGTAWIFLRARHRGAARLAQVQSERDKAVASQAAWRQAYYARNRFAPWIDFEGRTRHRDPHQRRSPRGGHTHPRAPPGGFIDPRVAEAAKREEAQAFDALPLFDNFADVARRFWGVATGKTVDSDTPSAGCATPQSHASSPKSPPRPTLTPAEKWKRAFGSGASDVHSDLSGWEDLVRAKQREATVKTEQQAASGSVSSTATEPSAGKMAANFHKSKFDEHAPRSHSVEKHRRQDRPKIEVDDAMYDELDNNFLRRHLDKMNARKSSDQSETSSPKLTRPRGKGSKTSKKTALLDQQREEPTFEGQGAREGLQKTVGISDAAPLPSEDLSEEDRKQMLEHGRLGDPTLYANEQNTIVDELASDLGEGVQPSQTSSLEELEQEEQDQEAERPVASGSLWEAALDLAEEEAVANDRQKATEQGQRQGGLDAADADKATSRDATPRRTVLEPEDLDEALVLRGPSHPTGKWQASLRNLRRQAELKHRRSHDEDEPEDILEEEEDQQRFDDDLLDSQAQEKAKVGSSIDEPEEGGRLLSLEARLDVVTAELDLFKNHVARLQRRLAQYEEKWR